MHDEALIGTENGYEHSGRVLFASGDEFQKTQKAKTRILVVDATRRVLGTGGVT